MRAIVAGDEARARSQMHTLLEGRSGVVLSQLAPQPLQQLGRLSLSRNGAAAVERGKSKRRKR